MAQATQKDIADRLGVSVSLVSRVLSGKARAIGIRPETIRRIRDVAADLQYVPSASARSLKGAATQTIGVVVLDFADPFFGPLLGHLQHAAHAQGHTLLLVGFEQRHIEERDLRPLFKHGLDALIVVGSGSVLPWAHPFLTGKLPVVRIGTGPAEENVITVCVDVRQALYTVVHHLVQLGRCDIGFVGAAGDVHQQRHDAFRHALFDLGLPHREEWGCLSPAPPAEAGGLAVEEMLRRSHHLPPAIVASSDIVALGALRALAQRAVHVPNRVSVTGFDDIPLAALTAPGLTTVHQPLEEMARKAVDLCLSRAVRPVPPETFAFTSELVVRDSTAPLSAAGIK